MECNSKEKYYVLGQLVEAVRILSDSPKVHVLLPEIRSNPVMAMEHASEIEEVAGIPGRLTEVFGKITAAAYPAWGASKFTALILLTVMKLDPSRRASMEIRYSAETVDLMKKDGISISRMNIKENTPFKEMLKDSAGDGDFPTALYTEGGFAREGAIIITGGDAVEVAQTIVHIADLVKP